MKEEFVTYEQALALKELGFNDYCYRGYDKNQMLFYSEQESGHLLNYSVGMNVSAPLKQQVFRWFREKYFYLYKIHKHAPNRFSYSYENKYGIHVYKYNFNTYEEAESACIDKLIELAKQQENETN